MANIPTPQFSGLVPQEFIIEAMGGPAHPRGLLDRFPDEMYYKGPESHLFRFMYLLLGPTGVGQIKKSFLDARIALEEAGLELFDLDSFFGDPMAFGRILEEVYDTPTEPVEGTARAAIAARDAAYRSRALDFLAGVRLGNSPEGLRLVAKAGLGYNVQVVENYRYEYDILTDDRIGYQRYGQTHSTEELIIVPTAEASRSEVQTLTFYGAPNDGVFALRAFGRVTVNLPYNAPAASDWLTEDDDDYDAERPKIKTLGVQEALEAAIRGWDIYYQGTEDTQKTIEGQQGFYSPNVTCSGGPAPYNPILVRFTGVLANQNVGLMSDANPGSLTNGASDPLALPQLIVTTRQGGFDSTDERVFIPARDQYHLQQALDRIKSVTTIPTFNQGIGIQQRQPWRSVYATSEYTEVTRYVTGSNTVNWPFNKDNPMLWIERNVEKEAPRRYDDLQQHYQGFHDPVSVVSYTEADATADVGDLPELQSNHIGTFNSAQQAVFTALRNVDSTLLFTPDRALADFPEQPVVTSYDLANQTPLILGSYPVEYAELPGTRQIKYKEEQFWASAERPDGTEYLELDLGEVRAVNYIAFESLRKPVVIDIEYDLLDDRDLGRRRFIPVTPDPMLNWPGRMTYGQDAGWAFLEFNFDDVKGDPIYTRYLRLAITRRFDALSPFLYDNATRVQSPWSVEVRNLRVGRNISY